MCASIEQNLYCYESRGQYFSIPILNTSLIDDIQNVHFSSYESAFNHSLSLDYFVKGIENETSLRDSFVTVISPHFGSISTGNLNIVTESVPDAYDIEFNINNGKTVTWFSPQTDSINSAKGFDFEPRSMFYSITPRFLSDGDTYFYGYPHCGHIEFVLSDREIQKQRKFISNHQPVSTLPIEDLTIMRKVHLCIWGPHGIDGQKKIWLQQAAKLNKSIFEISWIVDSFSTSSKTLLEHLNSMPHVRIVQSPFTGMALPLKDLYENPPLTSNWTILYDTLEEFESHIPELFATEQDFNLLYHFAHERLQKLASNASLDDLTPQWCRSLYVTLFNLLQSENCDQIIYGNSRDFSFNVIITDTARLLGIPSIAELVNVHLHPEIVPTVIVGPSHFAIEHKSVVDTLHSGHLNTTTVIISPGVDLELFDPVRVQELTAFNELGVKLCGETLNDRFGFIPCVLIGFIGRLQPEKNPALFLMAAREILTRYPFARFVVVGDGDLRPQLEELALRLRIANFVEFVGWVTSEDLPSLLSKLHIVVNPSLIYETFCLSNIEVMSMEVALVTFAIAGIGEYVEDPSLNIAANQTQQEYFSVGTNSVVVNTATPEAIAEAVYFLIRNPSVRISISRKGRETVARGFSMNRQIMQYSMLYFSLFTSPSKYFRNINYN